VNEKAGETTARVVVTGGSGTLGWACIADLVAHEWDAAITYLPIDLTDYGQVLEAMLGVEERYDRGDALVHLAAIPAPGLVADHETFANNMNSSFNVVSAARRAGITNIVWASSETVLGLPFDTPPPYLPVDEAYEPRPESTYSLTKTLEETMARHLCRWDPELKMIGLRSPTSWNRRTTKSSRHSMPARELASGICGAP
jgi:nucleoside-diphosphate-sugar epimerase